MPLSKIWIVLHLISGNVEIINSILGRSLIQSFKKNEVFYFYWQQMVHIHTNC